MKVLIINYSDKEGGAARATYRIYSSLKNKINIYLYVKNKNYLDKKIIAQNKFINILTRYFEKFLKFLFYNKSKNFHSFNLIPTDCLKIIKKINPDIVQLHWIGMNTISIKEVSMIKKPIIWRLSDMWPILPTEHYLNNQKKNFFFNLDKFCLKLKKKYFNEKITFVAPSKWIKKELDSSNLTNKNYKVVIPNAINTSFWTFQKKNKLRNILNIDKKVVITFGSTYVDDPRKGFKYLLQSLRYLTIDYKLIVFGNIINKKIYEYINRSNKIIYLGNINDNQMLRNVYSLSNVVVIPSIMDNSPNILFESNSCGIPVVAFNNTGLKDFVIHKKNGWLAKNKDIRDFSAGINWCLKQKNKDRLKKTCRKFCVDNFSDKVVSNSYINLYNKLLKKKN